MTKIYRGRNTSAKFLICCILSFQAIPVSPLKSLTAGHRKIIYMAINRLTKMFPPRQNVVEQPRAHLVANSSETAHPHGVRLRGRLCHHTGKDVSIHAPTRGATSGRSHDRLALTVSIHAHTWGTTACILSVYSLTIWFQSKLMHGRDLS